MNPLAKQLNDDIAARCPLVCDLLSERGRALYFPKGILSQSAEANEKAHRFNATIGVATEGGAPMALPSVLEHIEGISAADSLNYAPAAGRPELRAAWRRKLVAENPTLRDRDFSLPLVTHAITHGLGLVGDLFVDPGDRIVLPDKLWGNYRLIYEVRLGARIETFATYAGDGFNVAALRETLLAGGAGKTILLLNFPNNPTGYMPTRAEVEGMRGAIRDAAEAGGKLLVVCDDAYYGLIFSESALDESPFGLFAGIHPNVLTIKLDGATKELFVWGLRCGFISLALPPCDDPQPVYAALERKLMGAIRGSISSCANLSQSIVNAALESPTIDAERSARRETLRARAQRVQEIAAREQYSKHWDVYPFNAGYFMCVRLKTVDAEALRLHLLEKHGVGLISLGATDLRVAFSCLEQDEVEDLFSCVARGIEELLAENA